MLSLPIFSNRMARRIRQPWLRGFELLDGRLRLIPQWCGQCGNSIEKILTLFCPAVLHHLVVLRMQHLSQIVGRVVIKIQPCFCISSPGVLNLKQDMAKESEVGSIARLKLLLPEPCLAEPCYLTIPGQLERITGNAVDPRVADLLLHYRQVRL